MPQHHGNNPSNRLMPVPVAVLLLSPPEQRPELTPQDSIGLSFQIAGLLICIYTRAGDVIIDLDASPALNRAAAALDRRIVTPNEDRNRCRPVRAALICAQFPRPDGRDLNLPDLVEWMRRRRDTLAPDGFLLITVCAELPHGGYVDHATTVITAARTAGLIYHQHLIVVHSSLPECPPAAEVCAGFTCPTHVLPGGRHVRVHSDVFAFAAIPGDHDA